MNKHCYYSKNNLARYIKLSQNINYSIYKINIAKISNLFDYFSDIYEKKKN